MESTMTMINDHNLAVDSINEVNENLRRQTVNKRVSKHMIRLLENTGAEKSNYMYLKQQKDGISVHGQLTQKPSNTKIHGQNKNVQNKIHLQKHAPGQVMSIYGGCGHPNET